MTPICGCCTIDGNIYRIGLEKEQDVAEIAEQVLAIIWRMA